jgi:hypothetical protein
VCASFAESSSGSAAACIGSEKELIEGVAAHTALCVCCVLCVCIMFSFGVYTIDSFPPNYHHVARETTPPFVFL